MAAVLTNYLDTACSTGQWHGNEADIMSHSGRATDGYSHTFSY